MRLSPSCEGDREREREGFAVARSLEKSLAKEKEYVERISSLARHNCSKRSILDRRDSEAVRHSLVSLGVREIRGRAKEHLGRKRILLPLSPSLSLFFFSLSVSFSRSDQCKWPRFNTSPHTCNFYASRATLITKHASYTSRSHVHACIRYIRVHTGRRMPRRTLTNL